MRQIWSSLGNISCDSQLIKAFLKLLEHCIEHNPERLLVRIERYCDTVCQWAMRSLSNLSEITYPDFKNSLLVSTGTSEEQDLCRTALRTILTVKMSYVLRSCLLFIYRIVVCQVLTRFVCRYVCSEVNFTASFFVKHLLLVSSCWDIKCLFVFATSLHWGQYPGWITKNVLYAPAKIQRSRPLHIWLCGASSRCAIVYLYDENAHTWSSCRDIRRIGPTISVASLN